MAAPHVQGRLEDDPSLAPGSILADRYVVGDPIHVDHLGTVFEARDQKTKRRIAIRAFVPALFANASAAERLQEYVQEALEIYDRNIAMTYGMGRYSSGLFVALEWPRQQTLLDVALHKPMSLRQAYKILNCLCEALQSAASVGACHGALRPSQVVMVSPGKIKIRGFGYERALLETIGASALDPSEHTCLAPEVRKRQTPTPASDIFGLGGLLYTMLTGRLAGQAYIAPSEANPDEADRQIDDVLLRCLSANPKDRFHTPKAVKDALLSFDGDDPMNTKEREDPPPMTERKSVEVELDFESEEEPISLSSQEISTVEAIPEEEERLSVPTLGAGPFDAPDLTDSFEGESLGGLYKLLIQNDAACWMVQKNGADHGPFSVRELIQLILVGEIQAEHELSNMNTGVSTRFGDSPDFIPFLEERKAQKSEQQKAAALERSARSESATNAVKAAALAGGLTLLALIVAVFVMTRPSDEPAPTQHYARSGSLYQAGEIELSGSADLLPPPPPGRRRGRGSRSGGGSMSYEEAMNQVVELGDANSEASMRRLTPDQVAGVMNRQINTFVPCIRSEQSGGGNAGTVRIDMAILGNGRVQGASVRSGSPAFRRCVLSRVRRIRFPNFPAPRMGASYSFNAN